MAPGRLTSVTATPDETSTGLSSNDLEAFKVKAWRKVAPK
jgi:hypothetical protein